MKLRTYLSVALLLSIIVVDQIIKVLVKTNMHLYEKIHVTDWFYLFFTENHGMAFGMSFVSTALLTLFRIVAVVFFVYSLAKQIRNYAPIGFVVCLSMIIAGASGNIIDNSLYGLIFSQSNPIYESFGAAPAHFVPIGQGYGSFLSGHVVDMFYFPLFVWPNSFPLVGGQTFFGAVFNFADASISCGAVAMLLFYRQHLSRLLGSKKNAEPTNEANKEELVDNESTSSNA